MVCKSRENNMTNLMDLSPKFTNLLSSTPPNSRLFRSKSHTSHHFQFPFFKILPSSQFTWEEDLSHPHRGFVSLSPSHLQSPKLPACSQVAAPALSSHSLLLLEQLQDSPVHLLGEGSLSRWPLRWEGKAISSMRGQVRKRYLSHTSLAKIRWAYLYLSTVSHDRLGKTHCPR